MPGDISRSYKGPKTGAVPSWMDEPSEPTLPRPIPRWLEELEHERHEQEMRALAASNGQDFS